MNDPGGNENSKRKKDVFAVYHTGALCVLIFFLATTQRSYAQAVETLPLNGLNGPNGFALDKNGVLYVANEPGKQVVRITDDSIVEKVMDADSPCGLDFDNEGTLYVINFFSGIILRKGNTSIDTFATGLEKPADIKWDGKEYLYVSEYDKGSIVKIRKDGIVSEVATGFKNPFGLTFDNNGNLYVANNATGVINKVTPTGAVSVFGQIPGAGLHCNKQ